MKFNNKYFYLGISLFSAIILTPLAATPVKADVAPTTVNAAKTSSTTPVTTSATATSTTQKDITADTKSVGINPAPTTEASTTSALSPTSVSTSTTSSPVQASTNAASSPASTSTTTAVSGTVQTSTTAASSPASTSTTTASSPVQTSTTTASSPALTSTTTTASGTVQTSTTAASSPASASTTTSNPTTTTVTSDVISSNLPDNTVVNFADPLLGAVIKQQLNLKSTDPITVGEIKSYKSKYFSANETGYLVGQTHTTMTDLQATPIESLDGLQYLQLLPANTLVDFQAKIASDSKANTDLTPLDNLTLSNLDIVGNFSNPSAKEIDVTQLTKLNVVNASAIDLSGDLGLSYGDGITNQQLQTISPWLINYATNSTNTSANINTIVLSNTNITDFSSLKGLENGKKVMVIADTPVHIDNTPVFAVENQPITFTAKPILGLNGDDLAGGYHFSNSVPQQYLTEEDLTNLGNDNYRLDNPTQGAQVLAYGYLGFGYSSNPDNYVNKTYGNATLQYYILNGQPIIWQTHPSILVNYLNSNNQPLTVKGGTYQQIISGVNIGDAYDLTTISQIPGYKLTSPLTLLKGNFTQDPREVNLIYSKINTQDDSDDNSTTTQTEPPIQVYNPDGHPLADTYVHVGNNIIIASIHKNNQTFYQLSNKQWVLSTDFYNQKLTQKDVRTFDSKTVLVNKDGKIISNSLASNSEWKILKTVTILGQKYYEVANNEFILASDTVEFTPESNDTKLHLTADTISYNSKGQPLKTKLSLGSNWSSDGFAIIDHQKMYRIADDEWVKAVDLYVYQPISKIFHANQITKIYNLAGNLLPQKLPAKTSWKIDQLVMINGLNYYRVATGEFIKA
ncbi:MucBP domain-containing protein [Companilactobacillus huachuanensis]|uniref:MucBP domain-containing protein n=1 Tax=Companilactobacillus huachuanensis TaxID=2559914 RepID=A0ABW1RKK4_9LACO|nr:MucBP domain-containing protein [Companilactobacillus huachuanensis]